MPISTDPRSTRQLRKTIVAGKAVWADATGASLVRAGETLVAKDHRVAALANRVTDDRLIAKG